MATPNPPLLFSDVPENLPRCFSLRTFTEQYIDASDGNLVATTLKDDGGISKSLHTRLFYFEPSKKYEGRLMHIRCRSNNKYWMAKQPVDATSRSIVITGTATQREEDVDNPLCTLFAVGLIDGDADDAQNSVYDASFYLPRLGKQAAIVADGDKVKLHKDFFLRDLSDHVVLPRYVAFKGDNDKYLSACEVKESPYLQFSGDDIADSSVMYTTYYNDDGTVRLKSKSYDKFMRLDTNWIKPDGHDDASDKNTLFKVIKAGDYYGLMSMGNQQFCRRLTLDGKKSCLNAAEKNITDAARLRVEEPVLSREIYNVVYHGIENAKVYDKKTITMATSSAVNRTSQNNNVRLSLTVTEMHTSTWDATLTLKAGVKATITAGIPAVANVATEISFEFTAAYKWGETVVKETKQEVYYDVVVPKMKKVKVSAIASQAKCDVPFSYTQKDLLPTGKARITNHHDGIYTGMNTFDLQYETKEEDLPAQE